MHNVDFKSDYKPYIIFAMLPCYVHRFHINTIFMHYVDFNSGYKPYIIFEMLPC